MAILLASSRQGSFLVPYSSTDDAGITYEPGTWTANNSTLSAKDTNLVAYWDMDETSAGTTQVDRTDKIGSYTATDVNTCPSATGKDDNCVSMASGNSERLSIATTSYDLAALVATRNFTLSFWFKSTDSTNWLYILGASGNPANGFRICFNWNSATGEIRAQGYNSDTLNAEVYYDGNYHDGSWHHVAVTCTSASSGEMKLYVDGTLHNTDSSVSAIGDSGLDWYIGTYNANGSPSTYMSMSIDEFAVWDTMLSATEVTALYNSGTGAFYTG